MKLSIGFSPCPNDTFIFDALVNGAIHTKGLQFEAKLEDVQTLNSWAKEGRLDITKLSFPALFQNLHEYGILSSGAALGKGVGPLLISKKELDVTSLNTCTIAIPGVDTTANFLLSYAFPEAQNRVPLIFSEIEEAVLKEDVDAGVIIHENRFTYAQKGLIKICDLGEVWEQKESVPIPLGCIAIRRSLALELMLQVDALIRESLTHSFSHYPSLSSYIQQHAQEMEEQVMLQHIELYVNNYTMDLGPEGKRAITKLHQIYHQQHNGTNSIEAAALFVS